MHPNIITGSWLTLCQMHMRSDMSMRQIETGVSVPNLYHRFTSLLYNSHHKQSNGFSICTYFFNLIINISGYWKLWRCRSLQINVMAEYTNPEWALFYNILEKPTMCHEFTGHTCITCLKVDRSRAQPPKTGCTLTDNDMTDSSTESQRRWAAPDTPVLYLLICYFYWHLKAGIFRTAFMQNLTKFGNKPTYRLCAPTLLLKNWTFNGGTKISRISLKISLFVFKV